MARVVAQTGIRLAQGYHLGRPAAMDRDGRLHTESVSPEVASASL